jgi:hypothetical protein
MRSRAPTGPTPGSISLSRWPSACCRSRPSLGRVHCVRHCASRLLGKHPVARPLADGRLVSRQMVWPGQERRAGRLDKAFVRRIVISQALYRFRRGAFSSSTWWSIGFILAVQINYVIAPRFKPFSWLQKSTKSRLPVSRGGKQRGSGLGRHHKIFSELFPSRLRDKIGVIISKLARRLVKSPGVCRIGCAGQLLLASKDGCGRW